METKTKRRQPQGNESKEVVFVASITLKSGKKLFARDYGLKGFPIKVRS